MQIFFWQSIVPTYDTLKIQKTYTELTNSINETVVNFNWKQHPDSELLWWILGQVALHLMISRRIIHRGESIQRRKDSGLQWFSICIIQGSIESPILANSYYSFSFQFNHEAEIYLSLSAHSASSSTYLRFSIPVSECVPDHRWRQDASQWRILDCRRPPNRVSKLKLTGQR